MLDEVFESIINDRVSLFLNNELGIDSRAERTSKKRPDIKISYNGLLIGLELSYSRADAEQDAEDRIRQQQADVVIAVWIKEHYKNISENELDKKIRTSKYDLKVLTEMQESLLPFIESKVKKKPTTEGWFTNVNLSDLKDFIEHSIDYIVKEERVQQLTEETEQRVQEFIRTLTSLDQDNNLVRIYYDLLWKLYGLSLGEDFVKVKEIVFGQVALSIILSSAFYEHARNFNSSLSSLSVALQNNPIEEFRGCLNELLKIDYRVALENTLKILEHLPPHMQRQVRRLVELGSKIVAKRVLLQRDFAGKIYHKITGDIALRKGFATYYTEIPAAYLLASLCFNELLSTRPNKERGKIIQDIKIGDFSCGSGTLLTASYHILERIARNLRIFDNIEIDQNYLTKKILEDGIYGIDALKYAVQITAINLALMSSQNLLKQNLSTVYLGYKKVGSQQFSWLGSLELLFNRDKFLGILKWIEGNLDVSSTVSVSGIEDSFSIPTEFDVLIMNPPFSRATGRSKQFGEVENGRRSFFGFLADEHARKFVLKSYDDVRKRVRKELLDIACTNEEIPSFARKIVNLQDIDLQQYTGIGQAGEGLIFLFLASKYIKHHGIIAFVLPKNLLAGISWFLARILLASEFHLKYVIVCSQPNENGFSENSHISEVLIIARKRKINGRTETEHNENDDTFFVNVMKKPTTAFNGIMLADRIIRAIAESRGFDYENSTILNRIPRSKIMENIDNWNRFVAIPDLQLSNEIIQFVEEGKIAFYDHILCIKLTKFGSMIRSMGVNRGGDVIDAFNLPVYGNKVDVSNLTQDMPGSFPIVIGSAEALKRRMSVPTNMVHYAVPAHPSSPKAMGLIRLMSRLLIPNRIRWNTTANLSLYSDRPVLGNVYFMVTLNADNTKSAILYEKALVVWFASVWGVLLVLTNREETEGAFTRLNIGQWKLLPVLDVMTLDRNTLEKLANIFDEFKNVEFCNFPEQFDDNLEEVNKNRLNLDLAFLSAVDPDFDENIVIPFLLSLYGRIHRVLDLWI